MFTTALLGATAGAWALLAAEDPSAGWISTIKDGGAVAVLVLVLGLILADKIGTHSERNRLRDECETLRGELREQNEQIRAELVPTLVESNRLQTEILRILPARLNRRSP